MNFRLTDWMGDLMTCIGDVDLRRLKIPATHNSGSYCEDLNNDIRCQDKYISEQLEIGVRSLDVRVTHNHKADGYYMCHNGIYDKKQEFQIGLNDIKCFLQKHPGEIIFLFVRAGDEEFNDKSNWIYNCWDRVLFVKKMIRDALGKYMYKPNPGEKVSKFRHEKQNITVKYGKSGGVSIDGELTLNKIKEENDTFGTNSRVLVFIHYLYSRNVVDDDFWLSEHLTEGSYDIEGQSGVIYSPEEKGMWLPYRVKASLTNRNFSRFHGSDWTLWAWLLDAKFRSLGIIGITRNQAHPDVRRFLVNTGGSLYFRNTNLVTVDFVREDITRAVISLNIPTYVSEVAVTGKGEDLSYKGYTKIEWDLNAGVGGAHIYLWYKLSTDPKDAYTHIFISFAEQGNYTEDVNTLETFNDTTITYRRFYVNLNDGVKDGTPLYLYGTKNHETGRPIKRLFVVTENEFHLTLEITFKKFDISRERKDIIFNELKNLGIQGFMEAMADVWKIIVEDAASKNRKFLNTPGVKVLVKAIEDLPLDVKMGLMTTCLKQFEHDQFVCYYKKGEFADCNGGKGEKIYILMMYA